MKKLLAMSVLMLLAVCGISRASETKLGDIASFKSDRWTHKAPSAQTEGHYALSLIDTATTNKIGAYIEVVGIQNAEGAVTSREWADRLQVPPFLKGYTEGYTPIIISNMSTTFQLNGGVQAIVTILELNINGNKRNVAFVSWEAMQKGQGVFGYMRVSNVGGATPLSVESGPLKELLLGIKIPLLGSAAK